MVVGVSVVSLGDVRCQVLWARLVFMNNRLVLRFVDEVVVHGLLDATFLNPLLPDGIAAAARVSTLLQL